MRRGRRGGRSCWEGGGGDIRGSYLGTGGGIMMDSPLSRDSQVLPLKVLAKHIDLALLKGAYPEYLGVTTRYADALSATNM